MRYDPLLNFTAGEISPLLRGRIDIDAYKHAASEMTNFQPLQYGGVRRRFGTEMVYTPGSASTQNRLIPFVASVGDAWFLNLSDLLLQAWLPSTSSGPDYPVPTVWTAVTPYTTAQLRNVRTAQSGNFMVFCHPDHPVYALSRLTSTTWWFRPLTLLEAPASPGPIWLAASATLSIGSGTGSKTLTATGNTFYTADIGRLITRGNGLGRITAVASATSATVDVVVDFAGTTGGWFLHGQPAAQLSYSGLGKVGEVVTLTTAGFRNQDVGALILASSGVFKVTGVTPDGLTVSAQVIRRAADATATAAYTLLQPTLGYPILQSTEFLRLYPACAAFHDQRLVLGGLKGLPQTFIGSAAGDVIDFTPAGSVADAYQWNVDGATPIQHMLVDNDLLLLTHDAEYAASGSDLSTITSQDVRIRKQSADGSNAVAPVKVNREHVFVQRSGKSVMALGFDISINGYDTKELTLLAEHITGGGIVEMAFARRPVPTLYCVRTDGKMACLTLDSKQRVTAWWLWETLGEIESVATVPLDTYDEVWMIVKRTPAGVASRYIERIQQTYSPRAAVGGTVYYQSEKKLGFLVDFARLFRRTPAGPTGTVELQTHLSGVQALDVVADGYYAGLFFTDVTGKLTLPFEFYEAVVGWTYSSTLTPMPPEVPTAAGSGMGRPANATEVTVKVHESMGGLANDQALAPVLAGVRTTRPLAAAVPIVREHENDLFTGDIKVGAQGWKQGESLVTIVQHEPLPLHILAVIQKLQANP